jgi:UDP-N-acetylglucosamine 2-epimerase
VGTSTKRIVDKTSEILKRLDDFKGIKNPYGDGDAAEKIIAFISQELN